MNYAAYLRSPHWQDVRRRYWASKFPKRCACCYRKDVQLDLHHKTYKRLGKERLSDLILLCRRCHQETHAVAAKRTRQNGLWSAYRVVRSRRKREGVTTRPEKKIKPRELGDNPRARKENPRAIGSNPRKRRARGTETK